VYRARLGVKLATVLFTENDPMDIRWRFCSTTVMRFRLQKALLAVVFALSFI
jgi:hypothetical protein